MVPSASKMLPYSITFLFFSSLATSTLLPAQIDFSQIPIHDFDNLTSPYGTSLESAEENAIYIFNTLHSAMRQWGSSYHHNGMSLFPATVPAGINLYHGRHDKERPAAMEWLAFEIEHAENFARGFGRRPKDGYKKPGRGGPPGSGGPPPGGPFEEERPSQLELLGFEFSEDPEDPPPPPREPPTFIPGYLHTYRTNRPLNLIYIDGMGAAKTYLGTLDTQDILLLNHTVNPSPPGDMERARSLCSLPKEWNLPIDGFIRMEAGFEIIKCDFSEEGGLDLVEARQRPGSNLGLMNSHFEYMRGVSMRYHGIDASRVVLDYGGMISAYFYPANLTNPRPGKQILHRLPIEDVAQIEMMREDLKDVLANPRGKEMKSKIDWQGMTDMIVARYADRLQYIATGPQTPEILSTISVLLNTFIDYSNFNKNESIEKCTRNYFTPADSSTSDWSRQDELLATAILGVSSTICRTLFEIRDVLLCESFDDEIKTELAVGGVKELISNLDWSVWRECGKCAYDEVCFISMWPWGGAEDHYNPSCKNRTTLVARPQMGDGYWNLDSRWSLRE